ncbi:MAG: flagellar filament capping protein FliD [Nitrospirae bacterium]|nr:flagellar filament capping protein FliD [Nitrospirota bacterium]
MSTFTVGGLSTGVDYNDLISKLIDAQSQPIKLLESKKSTYSDKITKYSDLSSKLSSLKSAVDKLRTSSNFYSKAVSVSDSTVLEATVTSSASAGTYSVSVASLASEEKEVHSGVALSSTVINSSGSDKVFQYTYGGTQRSITVANGTTLDGLKNLINDDTGNPGVTATIVNDGVGATPYRLIITGDDKGAAKSITVDAGTTLDGTGSTTNFTSAAFTQTKTAADADFTVDGLQIKRSSNSIADVIEGVTINLKKGLNASSTITVTADRTAIKAQISSFVSAYNDAVDVISANSDYNSTTKVSGVFFGEATARSIRDSLRSYISGTVSGQPDDMTILAQLGITTNSKTGKLDVNSSTLDTKLASDLEDVATLFTDPTNGVANKMYEYINNITSSVDGSITLREKGLQNVIKDIDDTIRNMQYRLDKTESDLVRKFTALESLVSSYNTVGSYLTNFSTQA